MNNETPEQAAREYAESVYTKYPEDCMEDFMSGWEAGAKWREEQAAKLLAEKDAEIEKAKELIKELWTFLEGQHRYIISPYTHDRIQAEIKALLDEE